MAAPPSTVDVPQLNANFKEVYGNEFIKMSMVDKQLQEDFSFQEGDEPGREFIEAVRMTEEQGFTFGKAGTPGKRILNNSIAMKTERATVTGDIIEFKSEVNVEAILRGGNTKQAFRETIGAVQEAQRDSVLFHTEHTLLRGGIPVGQVSAVAADPGGVTARRLVTLANAYYTDAFWSNAENMPLDIFDSTSGVNNVSAVRRNTVTGAVLSLFRVIAWLPDTQQIIVEADDNANWSAVVAGDRLWRTGSYLTESMGMLAICAATGQTIFGISQSTYGKWNAYRKPVNGGLNMGEIQRAVAKIRSRSAMKGNYVARVHPLQWEAVHADIVALRRFDDSYETTRAESGHSEIKFYSAAGTVTIKSNVYMPVDQALITDDNTWTRRGVTDVRFTMAVPGADGLPAMYVMNQDSSSVQFRAYGQQTMYCNRPNRNAILTGLEVPA